MAYEPIQNPKWEDRDNAKSGTRPRRIMAEDFATEFNNIKAEFDSVEAELDSIRSAIPENTRGNVASCYYNPEANPKLVYKYNVVDVVAAQNGFATNIVFNENLPNFDSAGAAHFAFNLTPVSATGNPTLLTVTAAEKDYTGFMAWHLVNGTWVLIPPTECGFSFMVVDMDAGQ
jgi:hypothetical protein